MSDLFYSLFTTFARHPFFLSSRPVVIGDAYSRMVGPYLIACTHTSEFDVPLLIRHTHRHIDFLTISEVFNLPGVRTFYSAYNAFPVDRDRVDAAAVRTVIDRLERGRVVGMFPEGAMRSETNSAIATGRIRSGIGRIASMADVPIIPVVIIDSIRYRQAKAWLPIRRTVYGIAFGPPIEPAGEPEVIERRLIAEWRRLHGELSERLPGER